VLPFIKQLACIGAKRIIDSVAERRLRNAA
jgi:hypothetical protein